ncbi:MAG TPA: YdcF family protein [Mycobacteriales bacterium]|nr:YdcF family protein [Mycobacteriales bacterium]
MTRTVSVASRAVGAVALAALLVVGGTALRVWQVARQDHRPRSDAILVLGASQFDGRPSEVLLFRLEHALELWREGVAPRIVTVGGNQPGDRFTEAGSGVRWLAEHGVPEPNLVAVEEGNDTLQSVRAVARVFVKRDWRSVVIVTDPWHSLRSLRMARDVGLDATTSPTRAGPAVRTRGTELRYIARETAAYLFYRLFHRSSEAGPNAV